MRAALLAAALIAASGAAAQTPVPKPDRPGTDGVSPEAAPQAPPALRDAADPSAPQPGAVPRRQLEEIEGAIGETEARARALDAEREALSGEARALERRLIEAAAALQEREREITRLEREMARLAPLERARQADVDARRARLAVALAGLQRLESERPPALAIAPDDALSAARGAMLAGAVSVRLQGDVAEAARARDALRAVQSERMAKRRESEAALLALQRDRAEIDRLLAERRGEVDAHDSAIGAERERLAALAAQADDLRALVERIMAPGGDGAAEGPMRVAASGAAPAARGVSEARGRMRLPVAGERVRAFGDRSEAGAVLQGIVMAARPDAEVVAPYDGRIAFADVYGPLGKVLILALGGGYYFVLSGFEEIHGAPGEWVLAGEPVGRLGRARDGGTAAELYVELQKDGKPVDPWVWFVGAGEGIGR